MERKHVLLLLLFLSKTTLDSVAGFHDDENEEFKVVQGITEYRGPLMRAGVVGHDHQMRKLSPFEVCMVCRCCVKVSDPTTCSNMPCCFGIDCQLPNKPFGVCGFVPRTCNCTSCGSGPPP